MHAEDVLDILAHSLTDPDVAAVLNDIWYHRFILNVWTYSQRRKPLSTEQGRILMRLIAKSRAVLVQKRMVEDWQIDQLLRHPRYRLPLYQSSNMPREVRHLGANLIGFRFKLDDLVKQEIKAAGQTDSGEGSATPWFDPEFRLWIVPVTRITLPRIMKIIRDYHFGFDEATLEFITLCSNSTGFRPTIFMDAEGDRIVANVPDNEPVAGWMLHILGAEHF